MPAKIKQSLVDQNVFHLLQSSQELVNVCLRTEKVSKIWYIKIVFISTQYRREACRQKVFVSTMLLLCQDQIRCCSLKPASSASTYAAI